MVFTSIVNWGARTNPFPTAQIGETHGRALQPDPFALLVCPSEFTHEFLGLVYSLLIEGFANEYFLPP